jgi:hypothetical protein
LLCLQWKLSLRMARNMVTRCPPLRFNIRKLPHSSEEFNYDYSNLFLPPYMIQTPNYITTHLQKASPDSSKLGLIWYAASPSNFFKRKN